MMYVYTLTLHGHSDGQLISFINRIFSLSIINITQFLNQARWFLRIAFVREVSMRVCVCVCVWMCVCVSAPKAMNN